MAGIGMEYRVNVGALCWVPSDTGCGAQNARKRLRWGKSWSLEVCTGKDQTVDPNVAVEDRQR